MTPQTHRLTLAFDDAELEKEFRRTFLRHAHALHAVVWVLGAVSVGAQAAVDAIVIEPKSLHTIWIIRYVGIVPFLLLVALFGLVPERVYLRWGERVMTLAMRGSLLFFVLLGLSIAPLPAATVHYGTTSTAIVIIVFHALSMARIGRTLFATIPGSLAVIAMFPVAGAPWKQI